MFKQRSLSDSAIATCMLLAALVSAGCQGTGGDLFGARPQSQKIASNVNGTGSVQSIDLVPRSQGIGRRMVEAADHVHQG